MKKGDIIPVEIDKLIKLNTAESHSLNDIVTPQTKIKVKNVIPGEKALVQITKKRRNKIEGKLVNYLDEDAFNSEVCPMALRCGGCTFNIISPERELNLKEDYLKELFEGYPYEGLKEVSQNRKYRNKMEYSFGNAEKDGELTLGLHEKGKFFNILNTDGCELVPTDFETIRQAVVSYFIENGADFFHKNTHHGFLRYLVLREGIKTGEILVNLVTSSEGELDEAAFVEFLINLDLKGKIQGILWTVTDNPADAVKPESEKVLYGKPEFMDRILDKDFLITPYSFFQVNTNGADELFTIVKDFVQEALGDVKCSTLYDLYSGTGTIGILLSELFDKVYGVELVEEAVEIAGENAKINGVENIQFIAGDVLENAEKIEDRPDIVILDPPRSGIHPKSIKKILNLKPNSFIYVSCNPVELRNDLPKFEQAGYDVKRMVSLNLFPMTTNVETVCLLTRSA